MFDDMPAWLLLAGNVFTALAGYAVAIVHRRSTAHVAHMSATGPDWNNFTGKMEEFFDSRFKVQDERIARLSSEVERLDAEVIELREEKRVVGTKYRVALTYIIHLWGRDPRSVSEVPIPSEIASDLTSQVPP